MSSLPRQELNYDAQIQLQGLVERLMLVVFVNHKLLRSILYSWLVKHEGC